MNTSSIRSAVVAVGGQSALARALGVSQGLVWQWCDGRLRIPADRCQAIEQATNGAVTRYELRPDVFGEPLRKKVTAANSSPHGDTATKTAQRKAG